MRATILKSGLIILTVALLFSCEDGSKYDRYVAIERAGWKKDVPVVFEVLIRDTLSKNNLFLNIRNTSEYGYSNLFLIADMHHPNGQSQRDTLEYKMTDVYGNWLGKGYTDLKENKLFYKESFVFPNSGTYRISIRQAMRRRGELSGISSLKGIVDVGLRIESVSEEGR